MNFLTFWYECIKQPSVTVRRDTWESCLTLILFPLYPLTSAWQHQGLLPLHLVLFLTFLKCFWWSFLAEIGPICVEFVGVSEYLTLEQFLVALVHHIFVTWIHLGIVLSVLMNVVGQLGHFNLEMLLSVVGLAAVRFLVGLQFAWFALFVGQVVF